MLKYDRRLRKISNFLLEIVAPVSLVASTFISFTAGQLIAKGINENLMNSLNNTSSESVEKDIAFSIDDLEKRDLFSVFKEIKQEIKEKDVHVETSLRLKLIGVFFNSKKSSYAVIENLTNKNQDVFMIEDNLFDMAILKKIKPDRVIIDNKGRLETLVLEVGGLELVEGKEKLPEIQDILLEESIIKDSINPANLATTLSQARSIPFDDNKGNAGLRIFAIQNNSIYEKIGFKNGDIIKKVNNMDVYGIDPKEAWSLFTQFSNQRTFELELIRDNEKKTLRYTLR